MNKIKFGVHPSIFPPLETVRMGVLAEKLGFDSVWVPDHLVDIPPKEFASYVDPWSCLSYLAAVTTKVQLGTGVTDYQRMHPSKLAHIVATLDGLSSGRAALGIGAGEAMNTRPFGIMFEDARLRTEKLMEAVRVIKLLWSSSYENPVSFHGTHYRLDNARLDQSPTRKPHPPIYIGAFSSIPLLEFIGEVADGWYPFINSPETYTQRVEAIRRGARRSGRSMDELDLAIFLPTVISNDEQILSRAEALLKVLLLVDRTLLRTLGYGKLLKGVPMTYAYQRLDASEQVGRDVGRLSESIGIPEELLRMGMRSIMAVGSTDDCIEVIEKLVRVGCNHVSFRVHVEPEETLRKIGEGVIPYFRESDR